MGRFVNPGNSAFKVALASEIYIDKTNLLDFTNSVLGTKQAYICNSRPRRFGKSITADMLTAYYSKGCDSRELFMNYNIAQTEDFEKCSVGANMGTAMEGALKVGETIQVPGIAYELEEYIHGPNLQLTPNYTVFFIDGGLASDRTQEIFEATGVITDKTYMLTNKKGLEGKNIINPDFEINELITPLAFLPFFQILSYQITEDTHKWKKHPLMDEMKRLAGAKTLNYESSPLRKDMPQ